MCLRQVRLAGERIMLSTCPFVRPSVRLLSKLWTRYFENEWWESGDTVLSRDSLGTYGSRGKTRNCQFWGSAGQISKVTRDSLVVDVLEWNFCTSLWTSQCVDTFHAIHAFRSSLLCFENYALRMMDSFTLLNVFFILLHLYLHCCKR